MAEEALREQLAKILADKAVLEQQLKGKQEACRVSVKLPPFWPDKPAVWFAQVEAQFQIAGIVSDTTMYNYVVGQIDHKLAGEVEDIITRPIQSGQKYETLKTELIKRLSMSEEQKVRQLLTDEELGDRKPSQFLRHLKSLAGASLSDQNILRQLWMRRLPQNIQVILASQPELSLDKLADLADKILELTGRPTAVYATTSAPAPDVLQTLVLKVEELTQRLNSLNTNTNGNRNRSRSRNSNGQSSRGASPAAGRRLCWYHRRFGKRGAKCIAPCDWKPENPKSNQ